MSRISSATDHRLGLVALLLLATVADGATLVQGLVVRRRYQLDPPREFVDGQLLPLTAELSDTPGTLGIRHGSTLAEETLAVLAAVDGWLRAGPTGVAERYREHGVIVRFPGRAVPLEGASAGTAMALAAAAALLALEPRRDVALTGGMTATGEVTPVLGTEQKLDGARREGLAVCLLPLANARQRFAADPTTIAASLRLVGLERVAEALFEGLGETGPWAEQWRDYQALWRGGLERLAAADPAGAAERLAACVEFQPHDLTAGWFLQQARAGAPLDPLVRAAALRRLQRYEEAAVLAGEVGVDETRREEARKFLAECRREQAAVVRRALLARAAQLLADDDIEPAAALVEEARATLAAAPDGATDLEQATAEVACNRQRLAALARPTDPAAWRDYALAAERATAWDRAAAAWRTVRLIGPDDPELRYREAENLRQRGEWPPARTVLADNVWVWPAHFASRLALLQLGVDRLPGPASCSLKGGERLSGSIVLQAGAAAAAAEVVVLVDDRELGRGPIPYSLTWDVPRTPGARLITVVSVDEAGNLDSQEAVVTVEGPPGEGLRTGVVGRAEPFEAPLIAEGVWLLRPQDRPRLQAAELLAPLRRVGGFDLSQLRLGLTPGPAGSALEPLDPAWEATVRGLRTVEVWGQLADGRGLGPVQLKLAPTPHLVARAELPATIAAPGCLVRLTVDRGYEPLLGRLLVDGRLHGLGPADRLRLSTVGLTPGAHRAQVILTSGDGRHTATPPVEFRVRG